MQMEQRPAARHATYTGNRAAMLGGIYGPNDFGEVLTVVAVDYDRTTERTRVGFAYATGQDVYDAFNNPAEIEISAAARDHLLRSVRFQELAAKAVA